MYIIQKCDGTPAGKTQITDKKQLDKGNSSIWAGSTFINFQKGENIAQPKQSDDKVVLGYTYDGLPFMIVVDGMYGDDSTSLFEFIDEEVTPLIDKYAKDLADVTKEPNKVTTDLIEHLRVARPYDKQPVGIQFTMSIAVAYERDNKLQCSGFGIGDTAIALRRSNGEIQQLVYNNHADEFKDAFDDYTYCAVNSTEKLIERNDIFTTDIGPDDELVGYTWLQEILQIEKQTKQFSDKNGEEISIKKFGLNIQNLDSTLYDHLVTKNSEIQANLIQAKNDIKHGDDTTFCQIIIPTPELRNTIKHISSLNANIAHIPNEFPDLQKKAADVYNELDKLILKGEKIASVMEIAALTNQLLTSTNDNRKELVEQYIQAAKQVNGKASTFGQGLGLAMLALGVAVGVCGVLICVGTLGYGIPIGAAAIAGGAVGCLVGVGLFNANKQQGLSKAMDVLATEHNRKTL